MHVMCKVHWVMTLGALLWGQGARPQGFNKRYDAFGQGYGQGAWNIEQSETGFLVFSVSYEPDTINQDSIVGIYTIILQKINDEGVLLVEKKHKVPEHGLYLGWANCCDSIMGGGYVSAGTIENIGSAQQHVRLMVYNSEGDTIWTREYGDSTHFWIGEQVRRTTDKGFLIIGFTDNTGYQDGFAIKTDSLGNEQWRNTYGWGGIVIDAFGSAIELPNGYILTGQSFPQMDNSDMFAVRVDTAGSVVWTQRWGGGFDDVQVHSFLGFDGTVILAGGYGYAPDLGSTIPYLAKMDAIDGSLLWEKQYGAPWFSTLLFAAKVSPDANIIACGVTYEGGHEQGLLLRTTSAGDSLWMRNYSFHDEVIDQGEGRFWDVLPTADGGCIATGFANYPFNGPYPPGYSQDAWVVKVDSMGCIVPGCDGLTGITTQVTNLSDALKLWPNPLNQSKGQLHVGINLPADLTTSGPLSLSVTTLEGKLVLQREVPTSVPDEVVLDVRSLASGLYTLHLSDASRWLAGGKFVVE